MRRGRRPEFLADAKAKSQQDQLRHTRRRHQPPHHDGADCQAAGHHMDPTSRSRAMRPDERAPRRIRSLTRHERVTADADDVGEIHARIESRLGHEGKAEDGDRDLCDRVAIGLCGLAAIWPGARRAGAARRFSMTTTARDAFRSRSRARACRRRCADGGPGHDESDGTHGKILRLHGANPGGKSSSERGGKNLALSRRFLPSSSDVLAIGRVDGADRLSPITFCRNRGASLMPARQFNDSCPDDRDARYRDRSPELRRHARGLSQAARVIVALPRLLPPGCRWRCRVPRSSSGCAKWRRPRRHRLVRVGWHALHHQVPVGAGRTTALDVPGAVPAVWKAARLALILAASADRLHRAACLSPIPRRRHGTWCRGGRRSSPPPRPRRISSSTPSESKACPKASRPPAMAAYVAALPDRHAGFHRGRAVSIERI